MSTQERREMSYQNKKKKFHFLTSPEGRVRFSLESFVWNLEFISALKCHELISPGGVNQPSWQETKWIIIILLLGYWHISHPTPQKSVIGAPTTWQQCWETFSRGWICQDGGYVRRRQNCSCSRKRRDSLRDCQKIWLHVKSLLQRFSQLIKAV